MHAFVFHINYIMEKGEGIEKEGERHVFFLRYVRTLGEGGGRGAGGTI